MFFNSQKATFGIVALGTPEKVSKLYQLRELVGTLASFSLTETGPDRWKIWPKRNQASQSSCVYHARAKCAGVLQEMSTGQFIEYSAADYNKRSNKPEEGSYPVEAFDFWVNEGIGIEALEPSNNISAAELAKSKQNEFEKSIAEVSKLKGYVGLPMANFDAIISTLKATGKPIPLGFFATVQEWNRDVPVVLDRNLVADNATVRHEVCATPNFGLYNGQEGFTIEDSWGTAGINGLGVRWITRDFFTKRNYIPGLLPTSFKTFKDLGINPARPSIKLTRDLRKGMTGEDVRQLQEVYKFEDFFPANHAGSDYFGSITEKCTMQYQSKYGIASEGTPGYGMVGPKTREDINNRYK